MSKWIKVEDEKPRTNRAILIHTKYGGMTAAYLSSNIDDLWVDWMRPQHSYCGVTHWMELPDPPKEQQ